MKKITFVLGCLACITLGNPLKAQTKVSIPIGQLLDAGSNGYVLPDGTIVKAERVYMGTAVGQTSVTFGVYNTTAFGGTLNGIKNINNTTTNSADQAITLKGYVGDKSPSKFTRIGFNRFYVKDGVESNTNLNLNFKNAIGFHIWSSRPISMQQLLMLDIDGSINQDQLGGFDNQEWMSCFGLNNLNVATNKYSEVRPTYTIPSNVNQTDLQISPSATVNVNWQNLVQNTTGTSTTIDLTDRALTYCRENDATVSESDPDDTAHQVLIDFGTTKLDHVYAFWGLRNNTGPFISGDLQNSGISPLVFDFAFDFGDAPDTYGTLLKNAGARHLLPATPLLFLGNTVDAEDDGKPSAEANGDNSDNGTTDKLYDLLIRNTQLSTDTNKTYYYTVNYTNTTGQPGHLAAWLDWNGNGIFDASEGVVATTPAGSTSGTYRFAWRDFILTRSATSVVSTYLRVRYSTENISLSEPSGLKQDGEVEDYKIALLQSTINTPLPVSIISFTASAQYNKSLLKWSVAEQKNIAAYEVMRSRNGLDWSSLGTVKANDLFSSDYYFTDETPNPGANYYRLKSLEQNGTYALSKTLILNIVDSKNQVSIYPNPANSILNVNIPGDDNKITGTIYNDNGQATLSQTLCCGVNAVDIRSLPAGNYRIKLVKEDGTASTVYFQVVR